VAAADLTTGGIAAIVRRVQKNGAWPLARSVYEQLREGIVTLKLAPGTPLVEVDICARLRVSRTPVRAALERLHQDGLVTMTGNRTRGRGVVAALTIDDMRELFLLVGALDGAAARLAAGLEPGPRGRLVTKARATDERLGALSRRARPPDIPLAQDLDLQFHRLYEQAAAGPRLLAKLTALHAQRERYVRLYTQAVMSAHSLEDSLAEHEAIVSAIEAGDGDRAERRAAFNYRNGLARYERIAPRVSQG
jgi:DNA-binding GntR family transcriptional regulator